ncbi:MAG: hypothetical protein PVG90_11095 [Bacillota bacterium]|jgi:predicted RNA binding protein YcfA (HicA-like mRNA interferase family)
MSKLQLVDAKTMEKLLFKIGFEKIRQINRAQHAFHFNPGRAAKAAQPH